MLEKQINKIETKMKTLEFRKILEDPDADFGTGLIITRGSGFCFTLKQPHRWGKTNEGIPELPFGGIGGKLEKNELPGSSLHRESIEEVGSDVLIDSQKNDEVIFMCPEFIEKVKIISDIKDEPIPLIIFRSPRGEVGRKPFTNVLIYSGKFTSSEIQPLDDPALIELETELLLDLVENAMTVKEFKLRGGKITSRIELPEGGILKPIGTAVAFARCIKEKIIISEMLK